MKLTCVGCVQTQEQHLQKKIVTWRNIEERCTFSIYNVDEVIKNNIAQSVQILHAKKGSLCLFNS